MSKNVDQSLGLLLFVYQEMKCSVYYQKCRLMIRSTAMCLLEVYHQKCGTNR